MKLLNYIKLHSVCLVLTLFSVDSAMAAEDFRVRYNLGGTLGGEIFGPLPEPGWIGALTLTRVDGKKITGNNGQDLTTMTPGGTLALPPGGTPLDPDYPTHPVTLKTTVRADVGALAVAYVHDEQLAGGKLMLSGVVPLVRISSRTTPVAAEPALNWPVPGAPDPATRMAVQAEFGQNYAAQIQTLASSGNASSSGVGDVELAVNWLHGRGPWKVMAGTALVLPTGKYSVTPGMDPGFGDFYTLRPEARITYQPDDRWAFAGKAVWALNSRNRENQLRSGNWYGLEAAAGYMTPLGPVGLHAIHIQQYQDDRNNPQFGASRFEMDGVGAFWTTQIPVVNVAVSLQHMVTTRSKNALHSHFTQLRLIKAF